MALAGSGSKRHRIHYVGGGLYDLSWRVEHKVSGSRLLHHRSVTRTTDLAGAMKFARKWKVPLTNVVQLWARRVTTKKETAYMPDRVIMLLEGKKGDEGALLVCGWTATSDADRWPAGRLANEMRSIERQWRDLHGGGWKLEAA